MLHLVSPLAASRVEDAFPKTRRPTEFNSQNGVTAVREQLKHFVGPPVIPRIWPVWTAMHRYPQWKRVGRTASSIRIGPRGQVQVHRQFETIARSQHLGMPAAQRQSIEYG